MPGGKEAAKDNKSCIGLILREGAKVFDRIYWINWIVLQPNIFFVLSFLSCSFS